MTETETTLHTGDTPFDHAAVADDRVTWHSGNPSPRREMWPDGSWEWAAEWCLMPILNDMLYVSRAEHHDLPTPEAGAEMLLEHGDPFKPKLIRLAARAWADLPMWTTDHVVSLLARKHHEYGPKNVRLIGRRGVRARLVEKLVRYEQLLNRQNQAFTDGKYGVYYEAQIEDTLVDIVGLVVVHEMVKGNWFDLPLSSDMPRVA